jgi:hypothetical protein
MPRKLRRAKERRASLADLPPAITHALITGELMPCGSRVPGRLRAFWLLGSVDELREVWREIGPAFRRAYGRDTWAERRLAESEER